MDEKSKKPTVKVTSEPAPTVTVGSTEPANNATQPQVQYVKMEQSLNGVGGWLLFWVIVFAMSGIGMIMAFFTAIAVSDFGATMVPTLIFSPLLAISFIGTVVLIAMQKKLGLLGAYISIGLTTLYSIITSIVAYVNVDKAAKAWEDSYSYSSYSTATASTVSSAALPVFIGGIIVTIVVGALVALYFYQSKRVKATLVK